MKYKYGLAIIAFLLGLPLFSPGQNKFIEGTISYAVRIESTDPKQAKQVSNGTLNIMLKGNTVVKELVLNSGFKNTMIFNGNEQTAYSLRKINKEQYAIQLDGEHLKKKMDKCAQLHIEELAPEIKTIANFKTQKARITCNNLAPVSLFYTSEWLISNPYLFEDFPSFGYLPLQYDITNEDGSLFHFELQHIDSTPMDNNTFKIPDGYKIISFEEYKSWQH